MQDAIAVMRGMLRIGLAEAARIAAAMSGAELDLVESSRSAVEVAALVYQAQVRAARRLPDPVQQRHGIAAARVAAARHQAVIADTVRVDPHDTIIPLVERLPQVYQSPAGVLDE